MTFTPIYDFFILESTIKFATIRFYYLIIFHHSILKSNDSKKKILFCVYSDKIKWMEVATKLAEFHENQGEVMKVWHMK